MYFYCSRRRNPVKISGGKTADLCQSWRGGLMVNGHLTYRYLRDADSDGVVCE